MRKKGLFLGMNVARCNFLPLSFALPALRCFLMQSKTIPKNLKHKLEF